jgi:membrane associated rhomboid family serine protease
MAKTSPVGMDPEFRSVLSRPGIFLVRMLVFLMLAGLFGAILHKQIVAAFWSNPGLNLLILAVLVIGILFFLRQIMRLYPEIRWVNAFRISDPGLTIDVQPTLLAPMATMLRDRRGSLSLSTTAMRTLMDSLGARLDEARDTSRYLIGLLIFLGLLGTFWGLLETITSVGKTIAALDPKGGDSADLFEKLKEGLAEPLRGMGTAFSASLFGLAGSLVLGFLDLQAGHANNRFYNELEEWLSQITELTPGGAAEGMASADMRHTLFELQRTLQTLAANMSQPNPALAAKGTTGPGVNPEALAALAQNLDQIVKQMRAEQKVVREWVDEQAAQQSEVAGLLRELSGILGKRGS